MSLPSGYTQLEYIESHGTEYFDTGFVPNSNTRVVMDVENLATNTKAFFGARTTSSTYAYVVFVTAATTLRSDYCSATKSQETITLTSALGRYTIDKNKNVCTANGVTVTNTELEFECAYNLYLIANNNKGAVANIASVKLYSCQIYDNDTLIRDYIPCLNASGAVGLWDDVNSVFYENAGTGTFDYYLSKKHKTRIDGTGYETKSGRTRIDGTGYSIKKGRTLIDGTGYDIGFGTPIEEFEIGTSVYLNIDGVRTELLIVNHGNPDSSVYTGGDGMWVLAKDIYCLIDGGDLETDYNDSTVNTYAQGDFFDLLDSNVQNALMPITWNWKKSDDGTNWNYVQVTAKVFVPRDDDLSRTEAGETEPCLAYFENATATTRQAMYNGSYTAYWTSDYDSFVSSPYTRPVYVTAAGAFANQKSAWAYTSYGFRPMMVLPYDTLIDSNFNIM